MSEARWINSGRRWLSTGHTPYSSPAEQITTDHSNGVAIIVNRVVEKAILEWKPINDRLLKVRFNSKFVRMTVSVCYATTEDAEEEEIKVTGDLNARVGTDNTDKERTMGTHDYVIYQTREGVFHRISKHQEAS